MGAKASSLSCVGCKREKNFRGSRVMKNFRSSSRRNRFDRSYVDVIEGSSVVFHKIESRTQRLGSHRTNKQASLNITNLPTGRLSQRGLVNRSNLHHETNVNSREVVNQNKLDDSVAAVALTKNQSKDCPEMSTISLKSGQNHPISTDGSNTNYQFNNPICTPTRTLDVDGGQGCHDSGMTDTTNFLAAPPNSVNSQFISGITPLDSVQEEEDRNSDSVFESEHQQPVFYGFHANQISYIDRSPANLQNTDNRYLSPSRFEKDYNFNANISRTVVNESSGPGFDSDFGASAGVEIKIVSSDNIATDTTPMVKVKTSAIKRWIPSKVGCNERKSVRKGLLDRHECEFEPTNSSISRLYAYYKPTASNKSFSQSLPPPRLRPATVPETPPMHVTMEWDPYDLGYENFYWMEYIIPGITYPQPPPLNDEQYWL